MPIDDAVRAFLRRSLIVEVATLSAKNRPFVTPLWFVFDAGSLYITTGPGSRAGKNIGHHPEVALLFRGEQLNRGDRVLRVRGTATVHRGGALPVELRNLRKWSLRRRYYGQAKGGFGYIRIVPTAADFQPSPGLGT
jgi:hypothetical protein